MNSPSFFRQQSTLICFGKKTTRFVAVFNHFIVPSFAKVIGKKWHLFMGLYVFGGHGRGRWRGRGCIRLVHCWHSLGRPVTIGTPMVIFVPKVYQQCTNRQKQAKTAKRQSKQQKWPVYQSSHVYTESAEYTKSASAEYTKPFVTHTHSVDWITIFKPNFADKIFCEMSDKVPCLEKSNTAYGPLALHNIWT